MPILPPVHRPTVASPLRLPRAAHRLPASLTTHLSTAIRRRSRRPYVRRHVPSQTGVLRFFDFTLHLTPTALKLTVRIPTPAQPC